MASLGSYYFSDLIPYSVCVEWPYAYVVGSKAGQGGSYTQECRKLRIDTYPITVVDYAIYQARTVWTYLFSVRISGNYLYMAGGYNSGTSGSPYYRFTCIKVDKTNLSNIIWNHTEVPVVDTGSSYWIDAMPNSADTFVTAAGNSSYGCAYKLNASTGAMVSREYGVYSTTYSILDYYSSDSYVDIAASAGGTLQIWRYQLSNWARTSFGSGAYSFGGGELYSGSYYLGGMYYPGGPQYWEKPVWKLLQSSLAQTWLQRRDDKTLSIQESNYCSTVDGVGGYVYTVGMQYTSGTTTGPISGTLSKYDLNGNFQWAINYGDNDYAPYFRSLVNYGNYLIGVETNAAVTGAGWLRLRNKSDGAIATLTPMGHFFPTYFQV